MGKNRDMGNTTDGNTTDRPLAGVEGLEPPTPGFGDRCSGH